MANLASSSTVRFVCGLQGAMTMMRARSRDPTPRKHPLISGFLGMAWGGGVSALVCSFPSGKPGTPPQPLGFEGRQ